MNMSRRLTELAPSLRWRRSKAWTELVLRRAFGHLGPGTVIVSPLRLRGVDRISIGARGTFWEGAWLQCEPTMGHITIGDDGDFGMFTHIHAADDIVIGARFLGGPNVMINSAEHDRGDRHRINGSGKIVIGDDVFAGDRAVILGGVTIGDGAAIGAGAVVTRDVAPGATVVGVPAHELKRAR